MRAPSCVIKDIITHLTRSKPPAAIPLSCRFFEQLWCCRNTLTILKESPTAERIAWFATQSIQHRGLAMSIAGLTSTEQTTAIRAVSPANDVRALITNHLGISVGRVTDEGRLVGDAMRSLIGLCRETRQPVDLQLYVDDTTLARIWSNVLRFQCPHCGTKHETKMDRLASKPFSLESRKRNAQGISTPR
jgi:hypothetical protein